MRTHAATAVTGLAAGVLLVTTVGSFTLAYWMGAVACWAGYVGGRVAESLS